MNRTIFRQRGLVELVHENRRSASLAGGVPDEFQRSRARPLLLQIHNFYNTIDDRDRSWALEDWPWLRLRTNFEPFFQTKCCNQPITD